MIADRLVRPAADPSVNSNRAPGPRPHLPRRRERLRVLMRLKSQRQLLLVGLALVTALCAIMAAWAWSERTGPDLVFLGKGLASVETMPLSAIDATLSAEPSPSPSESAMASGQASYYGKELAGNRTASGETFDPNRLTAAHRTLPLGSRVRVTNPASGNSVIVRINDRGPFHGNRVIDLSLAAARAIGLIRSGSARVDLALIV